jgi:hypothetical protein
VLNATLRTLIVVILLAGLGGCGAVTIDESAIFHAKRSEDTTPFAVEGADIRELFFEAHDGVRINAWHVTQPDARGTVLFFGGNGFFLSDSRSFVEMITSFDVNLFMMDYRGYGRSEGTPTVPDVKQDGLRAYRLVTDELGVAPERLVVHGHSLGTFLTTYVVAEREAAGIVLQNPATNVRDWIEHLVPWYLRLFVRFNVSPTLEHDDNAERVAEIGVPTLVGGGKRDRITDWRMARRVYRRSAAADKRFVLLEEAQHNDLEERSRFREAYGAFLDEVLSAHRTP